MKKLLSVPLGITKPKSAWVDNKGGVRFMTGTVYYLLGVHSAVVNVPGPKTDAAPPSMGLGVTWYAQLIEDIASQP
jgi:hypothetical protein